MDIYRLAWDPVNDLYVADIMMEGWNSAIWTDRFLTNGDFTIVTNNIADAIANYPEDTFIVCSESNSVMIVETHTISLDEDLGWIDTITGRSLETFLENRSIFAPSDAATGQWSGTAGTVIQGVINGSIVSGEASANDVLPGFTGVDLDGSVPLSPSTYFPKSRSDIYSWMTGLLAVAELGIAVEAPKVHQDGSIHFRIYGGHDRTWDSTKNPPTELRVDNGDLTDPSYLLSKSGFMNVAYVNSPIGSAMMSRTGDGSTIMGISRRVLVVDGSDITTAGSDSIGNVLNQRGRQELAKYNRSRMISGTVPANNTRLRYRVDYDLGDLLTVYGNYGITYDMQVTEVIHAQDSEGERTYPSVAAPATTPPTS